MKTFQYRSGERTTQHSLMPLNRLLVTACLLVLAAFAQVCAAQSTTGSVYGTVSDSSGAVIPNAVVTITDVEKKTSHTTRTNGTGDYLFPLLDPGLYDVSAIYKGFKQEIQRGLSLSANQNIHALFSLQLGGSNESVMVNASTTLVDTREAQLGQTIDQNLIEDLPLNGRSPYGLAAIIPGVTNYTADTPIGARNGTRFSVNGLPASTTNFYLDGAQDIAISTQVSGGNILPNPDALQEVRLLTSNFDAEFGRSPGGVMSAITRSGTSSFHGLLYDYLRNDAFNSSNYFLKGVTPLKQNQFGAHFGGPLFRNKKAFFFLAYEGLRIHTPAVVSGNLVTATALERVGDFSQSARKPKLAPGTNCGTVAAPIICKFAQDPVALNLLTFVPVYDAATQSTEQQSSPANSAVNQGIVRLDYQLTPAHQIEAMFFTSRGTQVAPNAVGNQILSYSGMNNYQNTDNVVLVDTWMISSRSVNNLRLFYTQNRSLVSPLYPNHTWASLGSTVVPGGASFAPPDFSISGYFNEGTNQGGPNDNVQLAFGPIDTLTLTRGHHSIKLGGAFVWNKYAFDGGFQDNGIVSFSGGTTGNALADFIEGKANTFTQNTPQVLHSALPNPSLFMQDNWQITKRLALNLGLRWEVNPYAATGYEGTFAPYVQSTVFPSAPLGLLYPGDPGIPAGIFNTPYTNLAPRFGFAYDLSGNGKTGIRGGIGLFYSSDDELSTSVSTSHSRLGLLSITHPIWSIHLGKIPIHSHTLSIRTIFTSPRVRTSMQRRRTADTRPTYMSTT